MGESDFNYGMIVGARWSDLFISITVDPLGFREQQSLEFTQNAAIKKVHPVLQRKNPC